MHRAVGSNKTKKDSYLEMWHKYNIILIIINKLFLNCYISIDYIPDSNIDRKVAKAALFTSLFVLGILNLSYELLCLILSSSYNKPTIITLTLLSIFGTYFYYVTKNRGKKIVDTDKGNNSKRIWVLIFTSLSALGLFLINIFLMEQLA